MKPILTVVMPTYNEFDNIEPMVEKLTRSLEGIEWEAVFVDDDSPDRTAEKAREVAKKNSKVRCIHRIGRRGLSGACIEGMLTAAADIVVVMDADQQHDETKLPEMLAMLADGEADVVVCSRFAENKEVESGLSKFRTAGSRIANFLSNRLIGVELTDPMSGYFMIRREEIENISDKLSKQGFKILLDILATSKSKLRVKELPFEFRERQHGESKLDTMVVLEFLGLLIAKLTYDIVSVRFFLFCLVGTTGLVVHLLILRLLLTMGQDFFGLAQFIATFVAMTSNFALNNQLTYRDNRLRGLDFFRGLIGFYLVCSVGVLANVGVAILIYQHEAIWWFAGTAGVIIGTVWNYAASRLLVWKR